MATKNRKNVFKVVGLKWNMKYSYIASNFIQLDKLIITF